ncbi:MAG: TolC family protein [Bacteroidia bacterium]|nr:TolC family protein [Bacteroidia bacterium]
MENKRSMKITGIAIMLFITACNVPYLGRKTENKNTPARYGSVADSLNSADIKRNDFFTDPNLKALIDTALVNNQELNIVFQDIYIGSFEVRARKGAYLPFGGVAAGGGVIKEGRYTVPGSVESNLNVAPGKKFPDPLPDLFIGANISWEVDIWKKLRNSKNAAARKYLATIEGKNFMVTQLVAEIANSYYELMALDNQLATLRQNIEIQQNALEIVRLEKIAAKVTELAVRKFEAEVLKNQSKQYYIIQKIIETENKINFMVGRFPQPVVRSSGDFINLATGNMHAGIPSQLLQNRPDIRQAERMLASTKLDVLSAKAQFYPTFMITAGTGFQAFNLAYLVKTPESFIFSAAGQLAMPLINRNAIKANYYSANSRQIQAVYNYEKTILNAYIEVANQLSNIDNLEKSYDLKTKQVEALTQSIDISTSLFKSARADYMEVLLTQRDALESKFELIETKKQQMNAIVNIYKALGGGWK